MENRKEKTAPDVSVGAESTDNLYFSVSAGQLGKGLDEQLARFVADSEEEVQRHGTIRKVE